MVQERGTLIIVNYEVHLIFTLVLFSGFDSIYVYVLFLFIFCVCVSVCVFLVNLRKKKRQQLWPVERSGTAGS